MFVSFEYLGLSRQLTTICILSSVQVRYDLVIRRTFVAVTLAQPLFHSALNWPHKKRAMEAVQAGRQAGRIRGVDLLRQRRAAQGLKPTRRNGSRSRTIRLRRIGHVDTKSTRQMPVGYIRFEGTQFHALSRLALTKISCSLLRWQTR
jgi:hypothetical protein